MGSREEAALQEGASILQVVINAIEMAAITLQRTGTVLQTPEEQVKATQKEVKQAVEALQSKAIAEIQMIAAVLQISITALQTITQTLRTITEQGNISQAAVVAVQQLKTPQAAVTSTLQTLAQPITEPAVSEPIFKV